VNKVSADFVELVSLQFPNWSKSDKRLYDVRYDLFVIWICEYLLICS
jgi:hypothetical protein